MHSHLSLEASGRPTGTIALVGAVQSAPMAGQLPTLSSSVVQAFCSTIGNCTILNVANSLDAPLRALLVESGEYLQSITEGPDEFSSDAVDRKVLTRWLGPTVQTELISLPSTMRAAASPSADRTSIDFVIADCNELTPIQLQMLIAAQVPLGSLLSGSWRVFLYHKCGRSKWNATHDRSHRDLWRIQHHDLPNVGFEAHTYLHHIVTHYGDLAHWTLFLQGGYLEHSGLLPECPIFWGGLAPSLDPAPVTAPVPARPAHMWDSPHFVSFVDSEVPYPDLTPQQLQTEHSAWGHSTWETDLEVLLRQGLPSAFNRSECLRGVAESAQFAVSRVRLASQPRDFYQAAHQRLHAMGAKEAKDLATMYEGVWHVVMGEPACLDRAARLRLAPFAKEQTNPEITWARLGKPQMHRWGMQGQPAETPTMRDPCNLAYTHPHLVHSETVSNSVQHDLRGAWQLQRFKPWRGYLTPLLIMLIRSYPRRTDLHADPASADLEDELEQQKQHLKHQHEAALKEKRTPTASLNSHIR